MGFGPASSEACDISAAELVAALDGDDFDDHPLLPESDRSNKKSISKHWFFDDVLGAVIEMIDRQADQVRGRLAMTEVTKLVFEAFDYALAEKAMATVKGNSRFGKTESSKVRCEMSPGLIRYARVPCDNSMSNFLMGIARSLGMDTSYGSSLPRLRARIEFVFTETGLGLALDESQWLVPQNYNATTAPQRLNWVRTQIVDEGLPLVMVSTPQTFDSDLARYVKKTRYTMEQFTGRVWLPTVLPDVLGEADLLAVGRIHFPELGENALGYIANEARLSENYLQAVEAIAHYARFLAGRNGGRVTTKILEAAVVRVIPRKAPTETTVHAQEMTVEAPNRYGAGGTLMGAERRIKHAVIPEPTGDFTSRSLRGAGPERVATDPESVAA
jgi:hypothetical protein